MRTARRKMGKMMKTMRKRLGSRWGRIERTKKVMMMMMMMMMMTMTMMMMMMMVMMTMMGDGEALPGTSRKELDPPSMRGRWISRSCAPRIRLHAAQRLEYCCCGATLSATRILILPLIILVHFIILIIIITVATTYRQSEPPLFVFVDVLGSSCRILK